MVFSSFWNLPSGELMQVSDHEITSNETDNTKVSLLPSSTMSIEDMTNMLNTLKLEELDLRIKIRESILKQIKNQDHHRSVLASYRLDTLSVARLNSNNRKMHKNYTVKRFKKTFGLMQAILPVDTALSKSANTMDMTHAKRKRGRPAHYTSTFIPYVAPNVETSKSTNWVLTSHE
jgi:hypothetical protein